MKYIILALLLLPFSAAIGVSPAQTQLINPVQEQITLNVINDQQEAFTARIYIEDIQEFVQISTNQLAFTQQQTRQPIEATIRIPENTQPGTYQGAIVIEQQRTTGQETVEALPAIKHRIQIIVPRDGKHIQSKILLSTTAADIPIRLTLPVTHTGTQQIQELSADITIQSPSQDTQQLQTQTTSIQAGQTKNLETTWTPPVAGPYTIQATIIYDDQQVELQQEVNVGDMRLELLQRPQVDEFEFGQIAQIIFELENQWAETLRGVNANIEIRDENNTLVDRIQSQSITINALSQANLTAFWETQNRTEGVYSATATISYPPKSLTTNFIIGQQEPQTQEPSSIRIGILIILLIIFIYIAWSHIRKRREK